MEAQSLIKPYKKGRNAESISHLFYADEMLLFTNGQLRSITQLNILLQVYETSSCQKINFEKNDFYPSKAYSKGKITQTWKENWCLAKKFPFVDLGAPLFKRRCNDIYFEELFNKFAYRVFDTVNLIVEIHTIANLVVDYKKAGVWGM